MVSRWSPWKPFPEPERGDHLDAPLGPGVYELRSAVSGQSIAFGHSPNVALTLSQMRSGSFWDRWLGRMPFDKQSLEYRTMTAATPRVARDNAAVLDRRRHMMWSRLAG